MKSTSAAFRSDDEPPMVRSLLAQKREEVFSEALWWPICTTFSRDVEIHLFDKSSIKQV